MRSIWRMLAIVATVCGAYESTAADNEWRGFRGDGRNVAVDANLPQTWSVESGENVAWTADLPGRGVSSPIVIDGRVIVTAASGPKEDRLHVIAFDSESGEKIWHRQFWATGRTMAHEVSGVAANTPASDGERIFAFFSSNDLFALDVDGNVLWMRELMADHPHAGNDVGQASSPLALDGAVIVQSEGQGESFVAAFDASDGAVRWDLELPRKAGWSSPVAVRQVIDGEEIDAVAIQSGAGLDVRRVDTGERLWGAALPSDAIASPVFEGQLFVSAGGLNAVEHDGEAEEATIGWKESRMQAGSASPVILDGHAYVLNRGGVLNCAKIGADDMAWRLRLGGDYWATPLAAGKTMFCFNSDGKAVVVELGEKGKVLAEIDMGEPIYASPAVAGDAMFIRSHQHLWKIRE